MEYKNPNRVLTDEEWDILASAAMEAANTYAKRAEQSEKDGSPTLAKVWAKRANRVYSVLIGIEVGEEGG